MSDSPKSYTQIVMIDSSKRDTGSFPSASSFRITIPSALQKVKQARIRNYAIFNTSYVVNPNNNVFTITVAAVNYTITLTAGNYTSATLATELAARLNASGAAVYTVTDSPSTYKYTIAATVSTQYNFASYPLAAKLLGFAAANISGTSNTSASAYAIYVTPYYYLYVRELAANVTAPYATFTIIPNSVAAGGLLTYTGSYYQTVCDLGLETNISTLTLQLYDSNYNLVDLNGVDWSITFEFELSK